ncbi:MAG TPA: cytochrome c maturation protein CcmE [Fimbriimonadaceae bacterium]|nr:cytochrome c maturation protein CcmE [Fimbriimonadaceae bacterium]
MKLQIGTLITVVLVALAIFGVSTAFIVNASPYVSVSEARKSGATNVHLKGILDKSSISNDFREQTIRFRMKDKDGESMQVVYTGPPPQDMSQATEIVAIGSMQGDEFHSNKLLVKCPSKYEGTQKAKI